ncbi:MAG: aminoglycoside phosphotransferase [Acidobacteriaceae bacterium]|nr:aminoglycoside phosphotransferase [Acidobacteriaceae bacterium]
MILEATIPQEKSAAVIRALRDAFGVTAFEDIRAMAGGHTSSLVFRIVVQGSPYLLKIILRSDDPTRHYACLKTAATAGVAPRVWYTNVEDHISITDFVRAVPFPARDALVRMPTLLRTLHSLPPFPRVEDSMNSTCIFLMHRNPIVDAFLRRFRAAEILTPSEFEELFARYEQIAAVYPRHDSDMVSSHNDLFKPDNILFDGEHVWLADWETAFLNDRYADLAVVANLLVTNEEDEAGYLEQYFGQPPDPYQRARFFLMRQATHMFYAMVFLLQGSSGEPLNRSEEVSDFRDLQHRFWTGTLTLDDRQTKAAYGKFHWEQLLHNTRQGRWNDALRIVSTGRPVS